MASKNTPPPSPALAHQALASETLAPPALSMGGFDPHHCRYNSGPTRVDYGYISSPSTTVPFTSMVAWGIGLESIGLALVLGGLVALGAFTAPELFRVLDRPAAGEAMTRIFRRYDKVIAVALVLMIVGEGQRYSLTSEWFPQTFPELFHTVLAFALIGYLTVLVLDVNPKLEKAQLEGVATLPADDAKVIAFNTLHKTSERLAKLSAVLALVLLLAAPFGL